MAILRKKWRDLIEEWYANSLFIEVSDEIALLRDPIIEKLGESYYNALNDFWTRLSSFFFTDPDTVISDIPIFVSSFKFGNYSYLMMEKAELIANIRAYHKLLTDNGFAKIVNEELTSSETSSVNTSGKEYLSDIPQIEITENAETSIEQLKFISSATKNSNTSSGSISNGASRDITTKSWEENRKNLDLVYFNSLMNYIESFPKRIYSAYTLDSIPATELVKMTYSYYKNLRDIYYE